MKKFNTVFRGYDKLEVQRFIDEFIKGYESLLEKSKKTEEANKLLLEKISYYEKIENTMNKAIFNAESAGDQIKNAARKEAELLISEARRNSSRIINDALLKAEKAQNHAELLRRNTNVLKRRLRQIIESQLEVIDEIETIDFNDIESKYNGN
ncbi:MAG: DivIVA domain-containing protein [Bacilli bacterium]|nr:DivIVA domain-containing protein [Bacilli bacterium]